MSAAVGIEPTCVKIGFEQHYGECWNDAISMIIVFSDGYKEIMQPLLYNSPDHPELIEGFLARFKTPLTPEKKAELVSLLEDYILYLSRRVTYHLDHIKETKGELLRKGNKLLRKLSLTCSIETSNTLLKILNFMKSYPDVLNLDPLAAHVLSILPLGYHENLITYTASGIMPTLPPIIFKFVNLLFGINKKLKGIFEKDAIAYYIGLSPDDDDDEESHAVSVFRCGGKYYYYDDNMIKLREMKPFESEEDLLSQVTGFYMDPVKAEVETSILDLPGTVGGRRRKTRRLRSRRNK